MKLSAFNSFLAFFRKKAGLACAGSTSFFAFNLFLAAFLLSMAAIFGVTWSRQASAQTQDSVDVLTEKTASLAQSSALEISPGGCITQCLRITAAEGTKSIGQLMREQTTTVIPLKAISSFHFLVDASNNSLIFPRVEGFHPPGFQWAILPGQDKKLDIPEYPLLAPQALDFYMVRTSGTSNFILVVEFYP
jgi:hypothetical protein